MSPSRLSRASRWTFVAFALTVGTSFLLVPEVFAQEPLVTDESTGKGPTVWQLIQEGGWFMFPLAACSLAMVALVIFNFIQLTAGKFIPEDLRQQVLEHMIACRVRSAIEVASTSPSFLGRMLHNSLPKVDATDPESLGREQVEDAMAEFTIVENRSYMTTVGYLAVIAQISPMLGLLGTVSGMIGAFNKLRGLKSPDASVLAGDISEALVTTMSGLCIAIPSIVFFFILRNRLNRLVAEAHGAANEMIDASLTTLNADQQMAKVPEGLAT